MECYDLLIDVYGRLTVFPNNVLQGFPPDKLNWQPRPDCNSIGWLVWHLTRQQDAQIASLMNEQQLWIKNGWASRFNHSPNSNDVGFGHTPEQVSSFTFPDIQIMLDYHCDVQEHTLNYLQQI
ncbi:MAG: DinB family protein [Dehalococcoidales bacterium]|nr:DinB family protein [Dehalococcoidales bacterium]